MDKRIDSSKEIQMAKESKEKGANTPNHQGKWQKSCCEETEQVLEKMQGDLGEHLVCFSGM